MRPSDPLAPAFLGSYDRVFQEIVDAAAGRGYVMPPHSRHRAVGEALEQYWPSLRREYDDLKVLRMRIKYNGHSATREDLERVHQFGQAVRDAITGSRSI